MDLPAPRLLREVALLRLDTVGRLVLLRDSGPTWEPLRFPVADADYEQTTARAAAHWWSPGTLSIADVTAHAWATEPGPPHGRRVERRLFLLTGPPGRLQPHPPQTGWHSLEEVLHHPTAPADLAALVEGYWEGWLPEGRHRIEWD